MMSSRSFQSFRAGAAGNGDDRAFPRLDLLDVVHVLRKDGVVRRNEDGGKIGTNEGNNAMLQLRAGMSFGEEIGDLLHLQGAFKRDREIELPAEKQHAVGGGIFLRHRFDLVAELEDFFDLFGQRFERLDDPAFLRTWKGAASAQAAGR